MKPTETQIRAAAEVLAVRLWKDRQQNWEHASREMREQFIDRLTPLATEVLNAADQH